MFWTVTSTFFNFGVKALSRALVTFGDKAFVLTCKYEVKVLNRENNSNIFKKFRQTNLIDCIQFIYLSQYLK